MLTRTLPLALAAALMLGFAAAPFPSKHSRENARKPASSPVFHKFDVEKAVARANKDKKVVLVVFSARWAGPCWMLDKTTFSQEKVQKFLKDKTVAVKIDTDDNATLAKKYKVKA